MKADLHKHTLNLRSGDWDYIESMFKPNGIATAVAIRTIISNFVDRKRSEEKAQMGQSFRDLDVSLE